MITSSADGASRLWNKGMEVHMLCAEVEELEAQFDKIVTALENPNLTAEERLALLKARDQMSRTIKDHQMFGHKGGPCFEE
jgi:hypothetical protein